MYSRILCKYVHSRASQRDRVGFTHFPTSFLSAVVNCGNDIDVLTFMCRRGFSSWVGCGCGGIIIIGGHPNIPGIIGGIIHMKWLEVW